MFWLGIGVLIIGIALLILSLVLIKPLFKLAGVFGSIQKTTESLPNQMEEVTSQTTKMITTGTETLHQVNQQIAKVTPIMNTVGDIGRATNQLSSSIANKVNKVDGNKSEKISLEGFYGLAALIYLLFKRK